MAIDRSSSRQADAGYSYGANASPSKSKSTDKSDRVGKGAYSGPASSSKRPAPPRKDERSFFEKVDSMVPSVYGKVAADDWFATTKQIRQGIAKKENAIRAKGLKNAEIDKAIATRAAKNNRPDRLNRGQH